MTNSQITKGDYSPIINGDKNKVRGSYSETNIAWTVKAKYSFIGFILGIITSLIGSYLYDRCFNEKEDAITSQMECRSKKIATQL